MGLSEGMSWNTSCKPQDPAYSCQDISTSMLLTIFQLPFLLHTTNSSRFMSSEERSRYRHVCFSSQSHPCADLPSRKGDEGSSLRWFQTPCASIFRMQIQMFDVMRSDHQPLQVVPTNRLGLTASYRPIVETGYVQGWRGGLTHS